MPASYWRVRIILACPGWNSGAICVLPGITHGPKMGGLKIKYGIHLDCSALHIGSTQQYIQGPPMPYFASHTYGFNMATTKYHNWVQPGPTLLIHMAHVALTCKSYTNLYCLILKTVPCKSAWQPITTMNVNCKSVHE